MSTKVRATTRYLLTEQFRLLWQSFAAVIAVFVLMPLLFALVTGNIQNFSLLTTLGNLTLGVMFGFFLFIVESLTYDNFKLMIQNGISRKTYWLARVYTVILISLIGEFISALYYYAVSAPIRGMSTHAAMMHMPYGELYGLFFGNNVFINIVAGFLFSAIFLMGVGLTGMACGSLLALFSKWMQRLIVIIVPILGVFLLGFVASVSSHGSGQNNYEGLANIMKFLMGAPLTDGPIQTGALNPVAPTITMIVGCAIMAGIAFLFTRKLKLKN